MEYSNSQMQALIDEYIHRERDAEILRLRLICGYTYAKIADAASPAPEGWTFDGGEAVANVAENRLQLFFDGKPDDDTRAALKGAGFRWARSVGAWQRQLTDNAVCAARRIAPPVEA